MHTLPSVPHRFQVLRMPASRITEIYRSAELLGSRIKQTALGLAGPSETEDALTTVNVFSDGYKYTPTSLLCLYVLPPARSYVTSSNYPQDSKTNRDQAQNAVLLLLIPDKKLS